MSDDGTAGRAIGLVLGGGGGRGFAHIGALRALGERGLRTAAVAGASTGAVIAALHAAGRTPPEMHEIVRHASPARFLDFGRRGGLLGGDGIEGFLAEHLPARFEELELPLLVAATDIEKGELVVLRSGPLAPALLASNAFPGLVRPVRRDGRLLVDGGVIANLPVEAIGAATDAPVVAIDVSPSAERPLRAPARRPWWRRAAVRLLPDSHADAFGVTRKAIEVMQAKTMRADLERFPPALLVRPDLPFDMGIEDFGRLDEAIAIGYRSTAAALRGFDPGG